jgi:hypothetical protein
MTSAKKRQISLSILTIKDGINMQTRLVTYSLGVTVAIPRASAIFAQNY